MRISEIESGHVGREGSVSKNLQTERMGERKRARKQVKEERQKETKK